jgi:hypothetical protein
MKCNNLQTKEMRSSEKKCEKQMAKAHNDPVTRRMMMVMMTI